MRNANPFLGTIFERVSSPGKLVDLAHVVNHARTDGKLALVPATTTFLRRRTVVLGRQCLLPEKSFAPPGRTNIFLSAVSRASISVSA